MNLADLLTKLIAVKKVGSGWMARCPAHDDQKASLSVSGSQDGKILIHCHAGCATGDICSALQIKTAELFESRVQRIPSRRKQVSVYSYCDEISKLMFQTVRYEPKDFGQRRPDPTNPNKWIWNLSGVRRVLYRLPQITAAIAAESVVYVAEGEKDCDALVKHGFAATCNPLGAKRDGSSWLPEYTEVLRGAVSVIIIADRDDIGRAHARIVATRLREVVKSVKVIEMPDRGESTIKDAHDFFAVGGTADELRGIAEKAPEFVSSPRSTTKSGNDDCTPNAWFELKFPSLADSYGTPCLERITEEGIARVTDLNEDFFAASLGEKARPDAPTIFVPVEEKFYSYTEKEGIFVPKQETSLLAKLSQEILLCARACKGDYDTDSLEFRLRKTANLTGVLRKARGLLAVPEDFFSIGTPEFLPCANGILHLISKQLHPFNPSYHRRNKLAVPFDASAKCPLFADTLMRGALDSDDVDLLQRWFGMALLGTNLAQKLIILSGTAGGGKGTLINVLIGIIGRINLAMLRPQLLGERFEIGRFFGKTLLYGADVPANFLNHQGASVLKSLTGGDPITLEFKGSNMAPPINCNFNVIVTCNSRLTVHLEGDTDAWRRRLVVISYEKPKPKNLIVDLADRILRQEASGVLNFAIEGIDKLRAANWELRLTEKQQAVVDNLLLESASHAVFAGECLALDSTQSLTITDCFNAYVEYCTQRGWAALTRNCFTTAIKDEVIHQFGRTHRNDIRASADGKQQSGWKGLCLTTGSTGKAVSGVSECHGPDTSDRSCSVRPELLPRETALEL